jgi:hypothetical protein
MIRSILAMSSDGKRVGRKIAECDSRGNFTYFSSYCVCGHHEAAHKGHTTMAGRDPSTHCSQACGCLRFRPVPVSSQPKE